MNVKRLKMCVTQLLAMVCVKFFGLNKKSKKHREV